MSRAIRAKIRSLSNVERNTQQRTKVVLKETQGTKAKITQSRKTQTTNRKQDTDPRLIAK